jgi:hypothetical protein
MGHVTIVSNNIPDLPYKANLITKTLKSKA